MRFFVEYIVPLLGLALAYIGFQKLSTKANWPLLARLAFYAASAAVMFSLIMYEYFVGRSIMDMIREATGNTFCRIYTVDSCPAAIKAEVQQREAARRLANVERLAAQQKEKEAEAERVKAEEARRRARDLQLEAERESERREQQRRAEEEQQRAAEEEKRRVELEQRRRAEAEQRRRSEAEQRRRADEEVERQSRALRPLKVGVLLPRSGAQAGIGQDCYRGVELANPVLKSLGLPELEILDADTETNVEVARARAEKLIADGAHVLVGAFDSGQSSAIAQVAEQKGIPFVINIAAAPPITEQGYKFVFRNFPTAPMILSDAFTNQKEVFAAGGKEPKSVVFLHINDIFGMAMKSAIGAVIPKFNMPYTIKETISYDPTARDLSVEISKAKATGADALLVVSRLNDAILLTRELVKQRWSPMGILSMGPGWYEDQYLKTLGRFGDGPLSFVPWYDPNKKVSKLLEAAFAKRYPGVNMNTNHIYTFEALLVASDAYKRAKSTAPKALADAIRMTDITDNASAGPGISFNAKGQNDKLKNSAIQNRGGKLVTVAPKGATNARVEWPLRAYATRN